MDLRDALAKSGGAARRARLRELGISDRSLRAGSAKGEIRRVGRGGYALPDAPAGLVAAVALGGVASHSSAAVLHGVELWTPPARLHVTIPLGSVRAAEGVRVHRAALSSPDLDPDRAVTGLLRTLCDCARTMPVIESVVILDSALRGRLVTVAELRRAAQAARGSGSLALRRAVGQVDPRAGSPLESVLRLWVGVTLAAVRTQVWIAGVGEVDILVDDWLVVEADGFEFHSDRSTYRGDRRRANALADLGYTLLRFTWEDVRLRPAWVLAQVQAVLATRGRR